MLLKLFETRLDSPNIKRIVLQKDKDTGGYLTFDHFYVFKGLLGCGAFGVVVKAINRETNEECAVKIINRDHLTKEEDEFMIREAQILESLDHPNIVKFNRVMVHHYITIEMELLKGGHLKKLLKQKGKFKEDEVR